MKQPVILIGLPPQGLFLLREISRAGHEVHALTDKRTPGYYSKYGVKYLVADRVELKDRLEQFAYKFGKVRCYIASGALLDVILEDMPELFEKFEMYPRPIEAVAALNDKMETYRLAAALGVRTLPTYRVTQTQGIEGLIFCGEKLIAKWNRNVSFYGQPRFKTYEVSSLNDYRSIVDSLTTSESEHLILQQYVPPDEGLTAYLGGYFVSGACVAAIVAEEVRYHQLGIASYVREMNIDGLQPQLEQCLELLNTVEYTGFADIEFKYIPSKGILYLLEVNARPWGSMGILKAKYGDLYNIWANPAAPEALRVRRSNSKWCSLFRDMVAIAKFGKSQKSLRPFLTGALSIAVAHDYDVLNLRDLMPCWRQILRWRSVDA